MISGSADMLSRNSGGKMAFSIIKNILPLDEGVRVINTLGEKIITLDSVSGDNFFPRVLIYPNTFIQGQYVYNIIKYELFSPCYRTS